MAGSLNSPVEGEGEGEKSSGVISLATTLQSEEKGEQPTEKKERMTPEGEERGINSFVGGEERNDP